MTRLAVFSLAAAFLAGTAPATVLFTTLGPGQSYTQNVGRAISGVDNSVTSSHSEWGWQFQPVESGSLSVIKVGAHWLSGANEARVKLMSNEAGDVIGTELGQWTFGGMVPFNSIGTVITIDTSASNLSLTQGTSYWLVMEPSSLDTYAAWMDSSFDLNLNGRMAVSSDGTSYGYVNNMRYSAFAIESVPEPGSLLVLAIGGAHLLRRRKRTS
ncbi:MAG TPA: PEP-CTERM sorting domain-containing protein [Fimbriimonas sp.]|nr:PEP-CTERM sorting domain-containing protein [Fimbriimonas sp.]